MDLLALTQEGGEGRGNKAMTISQTRVIRSPPLPINQNSKSQVKTPVTRSNFIRQLGTPAWNPLWSPSLPRRCPQRAALELLHPTTVGTTLYALPPFIVKGSSLSSECNVQRGLLTSKHTTFRRLIQFEMLDNTQTQDHYEPPTHDSHQPILLPQSNVRTNDIIIKYPI